MRIALPQWQGRIAPVYDVAAHLLLVDFVQMQECRRREMPILRPGLADRVDALVSQQVEVLICGAITAPLRCRIESAGVQVMSFVCGDVEEVLVAYRNGALAEGNFLMPGCKHKQLEKPCCENGNGRLGCSGPADCWRERCVSIAENQVRKPHVCLRPAGSRDGIEKA